MKTRIAKWGNSLALRIPKNLAAESGLVDGTDVHISISDGRIIIVPATKDYELEDLVKGITCDNRHDETDWGPSAGAEVW